MFPSTAVAVSHAVVAASRTLVGADFAFVSGAHSMANTSSAYGFVIDLSYMNPMRVLKNYQLKGLPRKVDLIAYQAGATWIDVVRTTNGSGIAAIGAHISNVGAGGFSTGGGTGFLAGAHGSAIDCLRAMEVVLLSSEISLATKTNE